MYWGIALSLIVLGIFGLACVVRDIEREKKELEEAEYNNREYRKGKIR